MITFVDPNPSRQADFTLPISRCDDASWLCARPALAGELSAYATAVNGGVRVHTATTDVQHLPGTRAWSPPT